jgi:serine/threonine protein kinase
LSCASDIFSLGVVMLQALLGRHPTDYSQGALADGIKASETKLAISAGLLGELDRMLSVRPTARPQPAQLSQRFQRMYQSMEVDYMMTSPARPQTPANLSAIVSEEPLAGD